MITVNAEEDGEHILFHTEDEIMEVLIPDSEEEVNKGLVIKENAQYELEEPVAMTWKEISGELEWYIGFFLGKNSDDNFRVNHLIRNATEEHDIWKWRSSNKDEIHDVRIEHIISVKEK